jgi:hypothetical protein
MGALRDAARLAAFEKGRALRRISLGPFVVLVVQEVRSSRATIRLLKTRR